MKAIIVLAFLAIFIPSTSFAGVTGGLDYFLVVLKDPQAEAKATLAGIGHVPVGAEEVMHAVGKSWTLHPSQSAFKTSNDSLEVKLGRVEYGVAVGGTMVYRTTIQIHVADSVLGETNCTFVSLDFVKDHVIGPVAVVSKATANGIDSEEFGAFQSNRRCQVYPGASGGPRMFIFSDSLHIP
jgi:hypothetical protein